MSVNKRREVGNDENESSVVAQDDHEIVVEGIDNEHNEVNDGILMTIINDDDNDVDDHLIVNDDENELINDEYDPYDENSMDEYEYFYNFVSNMRVERPENEILALIESSSINIIQKLDDELGEYVVHGVLRAPTYTYETVIIKLIEQCLIGVQHQNIKGELPLHIACNYGASDNVLMKLIEIFPEAAQYQNIDGMLPLHNACSCHISENVILKLIEIFPEALQHQNNRGLFPLHIACNNNASDDVLMKLVEIFPEAVSIKCIPNTDCNDKQDYSYNVSNGCFALHVACQFTTSELMIRKLIEINPIVIYEQDDDGNYPIHCVFKRYNPIIELSQLLLDATNLAIQRQNNDGNSVLHLHMLTRDKKYHIPILEHMLQHSTNDLINIRNCKGMTPLHTACSLKFDKGVETLLKHSGIQVNALDERNETPLHRVFSDCNLHRGIFNMIKNLLDHPFIIINHKNNDNKTPLDLIKDAIKIMELSWDEDADEDAYYDYDSDDEDSDIEPTRQLYEKQYGRHIFPEWIKSKELLEEFTVRRRFHAYQFLLSDILDM